MSTLLQACDLDRSFGSGATAVQALRGVDLAVEEGEMVAIMGRRAPARARCCTSSAPSTAPTAARSRSTDAAMTTSPTANVIAILGILIGTLATILPARRAAHLDPLKALTYE